jgi:hypothetical protein
MLMVPRSRYKPRAAKKDDRDFSQQFCAAIQRWLLRDRAHTAHWRHQEADRLQQARVHILKGKGQSQEIFLKEIDFSRYL